MIAKGDGKDQPTCRNVSVSGKSVFKMLEDNICGTEFVVGQAFRELWWNIYCSNVLEGKSTPDMIIN